ncbi:hypothetical protein D9613_012847 [Agrocybe pediades]|uniref:Uncharacterized protein n=1 Tax=Agrocybe pediades TaxID=84607 RepID=A0A8H4VPX9_9AGAR|nr:hypothetical protein D9613_012847 [Agrocybe pediades]
MLTVVESTQSLLSATFKAHPTLKDVFLSAYTRATTKDSCQVIGRHPPLLTSTVCACPSTQCAALLHHRRFHPAGGRAVENRCLEDNKPLSKSPLVQSITSSSLDEPTTPPPEIEMEAMYGGASPPPDEEKMPPKMRKKWMDRELIALKEVVASSSGKVELDISGIRRHPQNHTFDIRLRVVYVAIGNLPTFTSTTTTTTTTTTAANASAHTFLTAAVLIIFGVLDTDANWHTSTTACKVDIGIKRSWAATSSRASDGLSA